MGYTELTVLWIIFFRIYRWRSACINRPIILPVHGRRYHLLYNDNPDYTVSITYFRWC